MKTKYILIQDMKDKKMGEHGRKENFRVIFSPTYRWTTVRLVLLFGLHRLVEVGLIFGVPFLLAVNFCDGSKSSMQKMPHWHGRTSDCFDSLKFSVNVSYEVNTSVKNLCVTPIELACTIVFIPCHSTIMLC